MRRSSEDLGFIHRFKPGKGSNLTLLLLLSGLIALMVPGIASQASSVSDQAPAC